jgi:hypothetical protein
MYASTIPRVFALFVLPTRHRTRSGGNGAASSLVTFRHHSLIRNLLGRILSSYCVLVKPLDHLSLGGDRRLQLLDTHPLVTEYRCRTQQQVAEVRPRIPALPKLLRSLLQLHRKIASDELRSVLSRILHFFCPPVSALEYGGHRM